MILRMMSPESTIRKHVLPTFSSRTFFLPDFCLQKMTTCVKNILLFIKMVYFLVLFLHINRASHPLDKGDLKTDVHRNV